MTLEQGKPLAEAQMETLLGRRHHRLVRRGGAPHLRPHRPGARRRRACSSSLKEPVGPVAAFTPWNFPINQAVRKMSAALAAGCSVILKGPEETPAAAPRWCACFVDAGVPAGVRQLSSACRRRSPST